MTSEPLSGRTHQYVGSGGSRLPTQGASCVVIPGTRANGTVKIRTADRAVWIVREEDVRRLPSRR